MWGATAGRASDASVAAFARKRRPCPRNPPPVGRCEHRPLHRPGRRLRGQETARAARGCDLLCRGGPCGRPRVGRRSRWQRGRGQAPPLHSRGDTRRAGEAPAPQVLECGARPPGVLSLVFTIGAALAAARCRLFARRHILSAPPCSRVVGSGYHYPMADRDHPQADATRVGDKVPQSEARAVLHLPGSRHSLLDLLIGAGAKERGTCCKLSFEELSIDEWVERLSK